MSTTYSLGTVTAYGSAREGGYTGTYKEFCKLLADFSKRSKELDSEVEELRGMSAYLFVGTDGQIYSHTAE